MRTLLKKFLPVFVLTLLMGNSLFAQNQYIVLTERLNEKTFKGIISRQVLENDTFFHWYGEAQKIYTPNPAVAEALQKNKDSVQLLVFMGTWCEDSHFVIPRFFKLTQSAGFSDDHITLIGVDRKKLTLSHLSEALGITNVPTIIVMKKGKEIGRVVEYGTSGSFDKDLAEILNKSN